MATSAQPAQAEKIELIELASKELVVSDQPQSLTVPGRITVTVPPGLLLKPAKLTISTVKGIPSAEIPGSAAPLSYDVRLGDLHELPKPITLEIPFDPAAFGEKVEADRAPDVCRWHPDHRTWVILPTSFDHKTRTLIIETEHLSAFNIYAMLHGYYNYEAIYRDSKKVIELRWCRTDFDQNLNPNKVVYVGADKGNAGKWPGKPEYIRDLLVCLEKAWDKYKTDFKMPSKLPVSVLVGKELNITRNLESQRTRMWGWILLNLDAIGHENLELLTAHELFHSIQNEYFYGIGMMARKWWMESTAEYAAGCVVWPGNPWFASGRTWSFPIWPLATTSSIGGGNDEVSYNREVHAAVFIDYLVRAEGVRFKHMWDSISKNWSTDAMKSLDAYLTQTHGPTHALNQVYPRFVHDWYFNPKSYLPGNNKTAVIMPDSVAPNQWRSTLPANTTLVSKELSVSGGYAAVLWKITPEVDPQNPKRRLFVSVSQVPADVNITAIHCSQDQRPGKAYPIVDRRPSAAIEVQAGDVLYLLPTNTSPRVQSFSANVSAYSMQLEPGTLVGPQGKPVDLRVKVEPPPPVDATYHWYFGDNPNPTITQDPAVQHTYAKENTYKVWVLLKSPGETRTLAKVDGEAVIGSLSVLHQCKQFRLSLESKARMNVIQPERSPAEGVRQFNYNTRNQIMDGQKVDAEFPIQWNGTEFKVNGEFRRQLTEMQKEWYVGKDVHNMLVEGEIDPTGSKILWMKLKFTRVNHRDRQPTLDPKLGITYHNDELFTLETKNVPLASWHYNKIKFNDTAVSYHLKGKQVQQDTPSIAYTVRSRSPSGTGPLNETRLIQLEPSDLARLEIVIYRPATK